MTVQIYNNIDLDAPFLTNAVGSWITVLDAVLVNGYGDKPGAGWTKTYSGTNIAVYRNNTTTGTGMYLWVNDTVAGHASVRVMKTVTDNVAGSGNDVAPTLAQNNQAALFWWKGTATGNRRWTIIADDRTIYINGAFYSLVSPEYIGRYGQCIYGAGDFVSYRENDENNYFVLGSGSTTQTNINTPIFNPDAGTSAKSLFIGRDITNTLNQNTSGYFWTNISSSRPYPSIYTGARPILPYTILESRTETAIRGYFRGAHYPLFRVQNAWAPNLGKLENDPSGPDYYALNEAGSTDVATIGYWGTSFIVRSGNWE